MTTVAVGACSYMITFTCVIYYQMLIKKQARDWLKIYLPLSVLFFIGLIVFYSIKLY